MQTFADLVQLSQIEAPEPPVYCGCEKRPTCLADLEAMAYHHDLVPVEITTAACGASPLPCPVCECPVFWEERHGALWCFICDPPSNLVFVGRVLGSTPTGEWWNLTEEFLAYLKSESCPSDAKHVIESLFPNYLY